MRRRKENTSLLPKIMFIFLSSILLGCELLFEISEPLQSIQMTPFQSMFESLQVHIQGSQVDEVLFQWGSRVNLGVQTKPGKTAQVTGYHMTTPTMWSSRILVVVSNIPQKKYIVGLTLG